jgi:hypothetical protein
MDPTWYRDPGDGPDLEAIRQNWDLYRYLRTQGVVGRWSHVFRPAVDNDDPIWYFQRMNREGSHGVILTKHAHTAPVYLLLAKRISGGGQDTYRGGPWNMCLVSTENAAAVDTGVYQDPVDGEPRFYGTAGEVYGPVNFKFSRNGSEVPYIRQIIKRGAVQPAKDQFFGMAIQPAGEPLIVTQLGLNGIGKHEWDSTTNKGKYRITIMRANDRKAVASAEIDMARGEADRLGFKYVKLKTPVRLDPTPGKPVVIRPRGLLPTASYDVRFAKSGDRATRRGADLMEKGIELESVLPGEILFLNLPKHPGAGTDSVPPSAPAGVTKSMGTNLGVQGIEVRWKPATDDNWISYYEILRDGKPQARAAIGNFYFDHTGEPARLIAAKYEVRAVDGDGNRSAVSLAASIAGDPPTYRALGGFAPTQGAAQWRYEEHLEDGSVRALRWEHTGYEGLWTGSGLARVGRIWMQSGRHSDVARVFVVPQAGTASIEGYLRKDPSAENHHIARAKVLHNGSQLWPPSGWTEVPPDSRKRVECRIPAVPVRAGDTLRFILEKTGEELPDPVVWDPIIVLSESSRMLKNGISQPLPWRKPQGMRIVMSR